MSFIRSVILSFPFQTIIQIYETLFVDAILLLVLIVFAFAEFFVSVRILGWLVRCRYGLFQIYSIISVYGLVDGGFFSLLFPSFL